MNKNKANVKKIFYDSCIKQVSTMITCDIMNYIITKVSDRYRNEDSLIRILIDLFYIKEKHEKLRN